MLTFKGPNLKDKNVMKNQPKCELSCEIIGVKKGKNLEKYFNDKKILYEVF